MVQIFFLNVIIVKNLFIKNDSVTPLFLLKIDPSSLCIASAACERFKRIGASDVQAPEPRMNGAF